MPAPIIGGLIEYLAPVLASSMGTAQFSIWDGETPRYDTLGNAVGPQNSAGSWPAVDLQMQEPGFDRTHTVGTNALKDEGIIVIRVWATTRAQCELVMGYIETACEKQVTIYNDVDVGGPPANPNFIFEFTLAKWGCWVDPNYRTSNSQLLYRGDMYWECRVHSSADTVS